MDLILVSGLFLICLLLFIMEWFRRDHNRFMRWAGAPEYSLTWSDILLRKKPSRNSKVGEP